MKKIFIVLFSAVAILASCTIEKTMTAERPMAAEFGQDVPDYENFSVAYLDLRDTDAVSSDVIQTLKSLSADLVLVATDGTLEGTPADSWIAGNCGEWNHDVYYSVGGLIGSSSMSDAYFEKMELVSGNCLLSQCGGRSFVTGNLDVSDKDAFVTATLQSNTGDSWIVILAEKTDFLKDYTFTDCLAAQNGHQDEDGLVRDTYVYASQGTWSHMSHIDTDPIMFKVNKEQR